MRPIVAFPALELYADVEARLTYEGQTPTATWGQKIKLHGANMSVYITPDGDVVPQSRRTVLAPGEETGFADWVQSHIHHWISVQGCAEMADKPLTVFGEWAGRGIQSGQESVCRLDVPHFFPFAIGVGQMPHPQDPDLSIPEWVITCPKTIAHTLPKNLSRMHVLPWAGPAATLNYSQPDAVASALDTINTAVEALDMVDPYMRDTFGIEGRGEGLVFTPIATRVGQLSGERYGRLSFKAKTERHRVRKQGKPATPKAPPPASAGAFVETYVTPARARQGVAEACTLPLDKRQTGAFVAWMLADVLKEGARDLDAMDLAPDMVKPLILAAARHWFLDQAAA